MSAPRKRASRSTPPMRRLFYWCAVLGLWALIVAGGAVVYVAANLPPIHSLEIPRRPPSIEIVGTGLTHDSLTQRYSINWKTDRAWGGTCRALDVRLADDTSHVAYFDFR